MKTPVEDTSDALSMNSPSDHLAPDGSQSWSCIYHCFEKQNVFCAQAQSQTCVLCDFFQTWNSPTSPNTAPATQFTQSDIPKSANTAPTTQNDTRRSPQILRRPATLQRHQLFPYACYFLFQFLLLLLLSFLLSFCCFVFLLPFPFLDPSYSHDFSKSVTRKFSN